MLKGNILLILILGLGLALRLYRIDLPLLEFYPSRQVQTAEIARNFYRYELDITKPVVSYLGPSLTPFLVEFPGYNFTVAQVYRILGSADEVIGRLFSIVGWIVSTYFLFQLAKRYIGEKAALISLAFYTFSPLSILVSRSFQPDQWMITMSLAAVYFLDRWRRGQELLFYLSATFASLALLLKIPAVIFTLIPAAFMIISKNVKLISPKSITYFTTALVPSAVWYLYATYVSRAGEVLKENVVLSNWFGLEVFLNPKYYANIFGFEYNLVLLPAGILLFLIGVLTKLKKDQRFLYFWLGSVVLYFFVFNKHNMTHEYYHLPFLPIAAIFIGIGAEKVIKILDLQLPRKFLIRRKALLLFTFSLPAITLVAAGFLIFLIMLIPTLKRAYGPIERFAYVPETARAIQRLTDANDLIIGSMDAGPSLVYYANRRGWSFEVDRKNTAQTLAFYGVRDKKVKDTIFDLEEKKSQGAVIFAAANKNQFLSNKEFASYMYQNYEVLEDNENYVIFSLKL